MTELLDRESLQRASVIARFAELPADRFDEELNRAWEGLTAIKMIVSEQVQQGNLTPFQGIGMLACVAGQSFGYPEFHGQPSASDALIALAGAQRNGNN